MEVIMATEKQINYIRLLAEQNNFLILRDVSVLSSRDANVLINFMKTGNDDYDRFRQFIRKRGPKIPNLVGSYLFEDNRAGEPLS